MSVRVRALTLCTGAALLAACSSSTSPGSGAVGSSASHATASGSSSASAAASSAASSAASTSAPPSASSAPSTGAAGGNAAVPASALATSARKAIIAATAFHLRGSGVSDGKPMIIDMHYGRTSSDGYVTVSGARVDLRYVQPAVYLRGGTAFWTLSSASDKTLTAAQKKVLVARLANKWVRVPSTSSGLAALSSVAVRTEFQKQAASSSTGGPYTKGPAKDFGTTRTVSFVDSSDGSTVYVAATGTPYPRRIASPKEHTTFDLTDWNVPFTAVLPPASQTITLPG